MEIEYVRGCENVLADALSRLDSVSIDAEVPAELARGVPSYACPVVEVDRLDARTDWIAQQSADPTIARVIHPLNLSLTPGSQGQFSGSVSSTSPAPFGHPSRLTDATNAVAASRERSQQAALTLFSDSPAALDISLQPFNAFTAAVELAVHTRRQSGRAAVPSPSPHSPPYV